MLRSRKLGARGGRAPQVASTACSVRLRSCLLLSHHRLHCCGRKADARGRRAPQVVGEHGALGVAAEQRAPVARALHARRVQRGARAAHVAPHNAPRAQVVHHRRGARRDLRPRPALA